MRDLEEQGLNFPKAKSESSKILGLLSCLPWGQNIVLFEKLKEVRLSLWYAANAICYGWSRNMLDSVVTRYRLSVTGDGMGVFWWSDAG